MLALEALLADASRPETWVRDVLRRSAWCRRVADSAGVYRTMTLVTAGTVFTDGMCPDCGAAALAQVNARGRRAA